MTTQTDREKLRKPTLLLIIAGSLTLFLGLAVGVAVLSQPQTVTLTVTGAPGAAVLCDVVVDGTAESHRDLLPITYTFLAESVTFAVIPESIEGGSIRVELSSKHGGGETDATGVTGEYHQNVWGSRSSIGSMSDQHIANMRAARLAEDLPETAAEEISADGERLPDGEDPLHGGRETQASQ